MSWGHLRWSQCKNGYSFLLIQSPVWYLSLGQGWWLIVVHLMQSISRFLLSSTLSRSPWASLFNSPTLAGGHGTEVYESPRAVWVRRKVAKVTEMATQSENVRNGKRGTSLKDLQACFSMCFHVFPLMESSSRLCYCHFLCFASVLRSQTSSHLPSLSCPTDASPRSKAGMVNLATSRHHKEPLWLPEKWPSVQDVQGLPRNSYSMATFFTPSRSAWSGQSGPELSWAVSGSKRRGLNREMLTKQQIYVTGHILLVTSPNW
jgi:hypothetical protein